MAWAHWGAVPDVDRIPVSVPAWLGMSSLRQVRDAYSEPYEDDRRAGPE